MAALRAEWIRARGSTLWWLASAGLLVGLVLTAFSLMGRANDASGLLHPQGVLLTGMSAPIAAIFAGVAEHRERDARSGGTLWRPAAPTAVRAARLAVVWMALAAFVILDFVVPLAATVAFGVDGVGRVVLVGLFILLGMLGPAGLAAAATRRVGLLPTLLVAFAFTIELGYFAERDWWWANPGAWPARLALPALGLHFNLLPLEPDSPLADESPVPALALTLLLAAVGFAAGVLTPRRTTPLWRRRTVHAVTAPVEAGPATPRRGTAGSALRGVVRAARMPSIGVLLVLTALVLAFAARYPAEIPRAVFAYVILPVGAGVLPTLVWPKLRPAWALMQVEHPQVRTALIAWFIGVAVVVCACAGVVVRDLRFALIALLACTVLTLASLAVTVRFGVMWALAATILTTIISVTIGGDVLASSALWVVAVPAWPETATGPRVWVALAAGAVLIAVAVAALRHALSGMRPMAMR